MVTMSPFIYINGFPGVGKLTIATELQKLLPMSKLINNRHLIDPVASIYDRGDPEYQPLRKAVRQLVFHAIATPTNREITCIFTDSQTHLPTPEQLETSGAQEFEALLGLNLGQRRHILETVASLTSTSTREMPWIFTDQQSSDDIGRPITREYEAAAALRDSPFVSIVLTCEHEENRRRLVSGTRGDGSTTKLTNLEILDIIRKGNDINRFGSDTELVLDVTHLSPQDAASRILEHLFSIST